MTAEEDVSVGEHSGLHQNLKEFHEKYKFNIKGFPKGDQRRENNIPDNIADLNTPMLEADHRVLKQMKPSGYQGVGLTPMLQAKSGDRAKLQMDLMAGMNKANLNEIKEEKEEIEEKPKRNPGSLFNNLKGL